MGPPTPPGYGISTHHSTPKSLTNAKFLAEVYLRRIREHGNLAKIWCARIHKASSGQHCPSPRRMYPPGPPSGATPSKATLGGYTFEGHPRGLQAGERKRRSPHQCLEHTAATSLLSLEFRAICTSFVLAFTISRNTKGVCFTCLFLGTFRTPEGSDAHGH